MPFDPQLSTKFYTSVLAGNAKAGLRLSSEAQARERTLNVCAELRRASVRSGIRSIAPGVVETIVGLRTQASFTNIGEHLRNVARDLDELAIFSHQEAFRSDRSEQAFYVTYQMEQAPDPDSRVTLAPELDELGMRRASLEWRFGDLERQTLHKVNAIMAQAFGTSGLGRIGEIPNEAGSDWPTGVRGAWHQMGTTRMSRDAKLGVVDAHCRVHGLSNLYVAGSSVFSTSGCSPPTLTIVALALRLADHLKRSIREG